MTEVQRPGPHSVVPPGVWVDDSDEDDPVLRNADGTMVDTWREDYPYAERLGRDDYEREKGASRWSCSSCSPAGR